MQLLSLASLINVIPPLLPLTVLIPETIKVNLVDFESGVLLTNRVQVELGVVAADLSRIVHRQDLDHCLEIFVLAALFDQRVVQRPEEDRKDNCFDTDKCAHIDTVLEEPEGRAVLAD